ncbi:MAG: tetratricopeptide repeat protein, partial [Planctomycetales bacterium]|nr:tetratricopeptide repeat protein [Planctomycetales bacterium]
KDSLAPKAQHYLGVCYMQLQPPQYSQAAGAFGDVVKNHPKFEMLQDSLLNLGWCQYSLAQAGQQDLFATAAATFDTLAKQYPQGKYLDQALFYYGEARYAAGNREEAIKGYQAVVSNETLAKSPLRCDALYALGVTQEEMKDYASASKVYDVFLKDCADSKLVDEVRMRKAETVLQAGQLEEAAKMFASVAAIEGFPLADHAIFRQAFCASKLDKFAEAADLYAAIPTKYKESGYVAEATMSAARAYYRAENYADAAKWFQATLAAKGEDAPEAAHWIARILIRDGKPAEAAKVAGDAVAGAEGSAWLVNLKLDNADALYEIPDQKAASVAAYLKLANEHADHELAPQALYNAAFTELELKNFDSALPHVTTFLQKYPEHRLTPDVKYVGAEANLQLGKHAEAEKLYADLVASYPEHPQREQFTVRLGLSQYLQKAYDKTVATLTPQLAKLTTPDQVAEAQFLIGASQFYLDKPVEAVAALNASLSANAKWRQADETLLLLSRSLRKQNKLDEAIATVKKLIAEFPESGTLDQAHFRYGEYAYAADDFATAAAEYEKVAANWPESLFTPYAVYGKGWSQLKQADYAAAAESLTKVITGSPQHPLVPEARFARSMCLRQTGKFDEAIADADAYLATKPDVQQQSHALYERGMAYVGLKNYTEAVKTFESLLAANPDYAGGDKVLYELGWAHKELEQAEPAVANFTKLAEKYPQSPLAAEAHFHIGEDLYGKMQYVAAGKEYEIARQQATLGELNEKATYKLGWAQFQAEEFAESLKSFTDQVAKHPEGPLAKDGLFMKAESLFKLNQYADALAAFTAAQKLIAGDETTQPEIRQLLALHAGQSASQTKQYDQALKFLTPFPQQFPQSNYLAEAHYEIGWAQQNLNQTEPAFASYELAATKSRGEVGARARFMMGELKFAQKAYQEAIAEFQRCMFGYGAEQAPTEVKNWQAKSGYEAGRCADVRIKDAAAADRAGLISDATRYYEYVAQKHPEHELAKEAQKRLAELAKLK